MWWYIIAIILGICLLSMVARLYVKNKHLEERAEWLAKENQGLYKSLKEEREFYNGLVDLRMDQVLDLEEFLESMERDRDNAYVCLEMLLK